jgi:hypothetical protein
MEIVVHHYSSSVSSYADIPNLGWTKLKLVSSTATTSGGNRYKIDNGELINATSLLGQDIDISSARLVSLNVNRTGENSATWLFHN